MTALDGKSRPADSGLSYFSLSARWIIPLALVALGCGLGLWQLERLAWKQDLLTRLEAQLASPPIPASPAMDRNPAGSEFYRVTVTGRYLTGKDIRILARPRGGRAGYEVLTPLMRADGGAPLLVNRGFLPLGDVATLPADGLIQITGMLRLPREPGWMQPDNSSTATLAEPWIRADPQRMGPVLGLELAPWILEAEPDPARPDGLVMNGIRARADLPNNHLQYALTWFALAATLLVVAVLANRSASSRSKHPLAPRGTTR